MTEYVLTSAIVNFSNDDDYSKSEEAVRKRNYRDERESEEQADERRAKDNAAKKKKKDKETPEQQKASKAANAARMRASRAAKKAAKLAESQPRESIPSTSKMANAQNPGLAKFQKLQTPPKSLLSSRGSESSDDSTSEYEKLRIRNIEERKKKFKDQFGFSDPLASQKEGKPHGKSRSTKTTKLQNSHIRLPRLSDENLVENSEIQITGHAKETFNNDSYAEKLADLVKEGHLFANTAHLEYLYGSNLMDEPPTDIICGGKIIKKKRRKANLDRKSKKAKKSQMYRENETQDQYKNRLEQSAKYNRNLPNYEVEKRKHVRRLKR